MEIIFWLLEDSLRLGLAGGVFVLVLGAPICLLVFARKRKTRRLVGKQPTPVQTGQQSNEVSGLRPAAAMRLLNQETGSIWQIESFPVTIGRHAGNAVVLKNDAVSGDHAKIYLDSDLQAVCIEDLGSKNGTYVNGLPTKRNLLQDQDQITLGDITLIFQRPQLSGESQ